MKLAVTTTEGRPALWQQGYGTPEYGESVVIGDAFARPKQALVSLPSRERDDEHHCLIPLEDGDTVVVTTRKKGSVIARVYTAKVQSNQASLYLLNEKLQGRWTLPLRRDIPALNSMISTSERITHEKPCNVPFFILRAERRYT